MAKNAVGVDGWGQDAREPLLGCHTALWSLSCRVLVIGMRADVEDEMKMKISTLRTIRSANHRLDCLPCSSFLCRAADPCPGLLPLPLPRRQADRALLRDATPS